MHSTTAIQKKKKSKCTDKNILNGLDLDKPFEMVEESFEGLNLANPNLSSPLKSSEESNLKQQLHVCWVFFTFSFCYFNLWCLDL